MAEDIKFTMTKPGILAHPNVVTPKAFSQNGKPAAADAKKVYSASFVIAQDHPDVAPMKQNILAAAKALWPGVNIIEAIKAGSIKVPFSTGDRIADKRVAKLKAQGKEDDHKGDYMRGQVVFKASSDFPPGLGVARYKMAVIDGVERKVFDGPIDVTEENKGMHKGAFYFGTQACGRFTYRAYEVNDTKGVKAYLDMVLTFNRGKKLAGEKSAAEAFKGVAGMVSTEDPTGGENTLDDEILF